MGDILGPVIVVTGRVYFGNLPLPMAVLGHLRDIVWLRKWKTIFRLCHLMCTVSLCHTKLPSRPNACGILLGSCQPLDLIGPFIRTPFSPPLSEIFLAEEDVKEVLNTSLLEAEHSVLIEVSLLNWDKESG